MLHQTNLGSRYVHIGMHLVKYLHIKYQGFLKQIYVKNWRPRLSNLKNICSPDLESVFCSKKIAPKQNNGKLSTLKNAVIWQVFSPSFDTFCHKSWLHVKYIVKLQRL